MNGKRLALTFIFVFLTLTLVETRLVNLTIANFTPVLPPDNVVIEADGRVVGTDKIVQNGNVYTFIDNVSGTKTIQGNFAGNMSSALAVHRSNIVIDGAGFTLEGNGGKTGIDLSNGVCHKGEHEIWNVTIKNLRITNCSWGVRCDFGGNHTFYNDCISNDYLTNEDRGVLFWGSSGNNVTHCTIGGSPSVYMHFGCYYNVVTENNIVAGVTIAISGDETFDSNYWGDYLTRYPNATEVDSSGIGNIPYTFQDSQIDRRTFQDTHPLMKPITIPSFPTTALPSFQTSQQQEALPTLFATIPIAFVIACVILLVYFKKTKNRNKFWKIRQETLTNV